MSAYITSDVLRYLFTTSLLVDVIPLEVRRSERLMNHVVHVNKFSEQLSPAGKVLLSYFSPETQLKLARDFYLDDIKINKEILKEEMTDPTYIYFDNQGVGLYLELWICANMHCPGCGEKLYKYANPNIPAVDVRCINPKHNFEKSPIYFQIKATETGSMFAGLKYFDYNEGYVCIGSKKYGYNCHVIRGDDSKNRDLLIGYICIEYTYANPLNNQIRINMHASYMIFPNMVFNPVDEREKAFTFYHYDDSYRIPVIRFNNNIVKKYRFSEYFDKPIDIIDLNLYYSIKKIYTDIPPLAPVLYSENKYLKYKTKYLELKNPKL